jgi:pSer/pThr/pTyr-binding forkhead associated (FHA) protein
MEYALVFLDRPDIHNVKLDTDHPVLIGRDAQRATVFLNDQSVSRIHCTVSLVPQNNGVSPFTQYLNPNQHLTNSPDAFAFDNGFE